MVVRQAPVAAAASCASWSVGRVAASYRTGEVMYALISSMRMALWSAGSAATSDSIEAAQV